MNLLIENNKGVGVLFIYLFIIIIVGGTSLSPIWYCLLWEWVEEADATRMNLLNPTLGRNASHLQLISMSSQVRLSKFVQVASAFSTHSQSEQYLIGKIRSSHNNY